MNFTNVGGFGEHLLSYSMGTKGSFPEGGFGGTGRGTDHLPYMLRLRMGGGILKLPLTPYDVYRDNFFRKGK